MGATAMSDLAVDVVKADGPYDDQRPGTSGLRKRVATFQKGTYLQNFVQAILDAVEETTSGLDKSKPILLSGDGRYFNKQACQIILKMLAANGYKHVIVGTDFLLSTPAVSVLIRSHSATGGIILTASHNPGGPDGDFGVKYNVGNGGAAPESFTDLVFAKSRKISHFKTVHNLPEFDAGKVGKQQILPGFTVEVVDGPAAHAGLLKTIFDFAAIKKFIQDTRFTVLHDSMNGVAGPTALRILVEELGLPRSSVVREKPLEDFGGAHPDPNLTYAPELVQRMGLQPGAAQGPIPDFGAANDGDMDRNMVLGREFFVTPSDSLAIIAAHAARGAIPFYCRTPLRGVARSMPTSSAVDRVAKQLGIPIYEVPTGWKFFCNLMDSGRIGICGEESFGTGSDHIREKDGMWAVLAWLSIMEFNNRDGQRRSVADVVRAHWAEYGRNYYSRYDYEGVESQAADRVFARLRQLIAKPHVGTDYGEFALDIADEFEYKDPVDGSVTRQQGVRFLFTDGSRIIYRLSGTGSVGATIRIYMERYESRPDHLDQATADALKPLVDIALRLSDIAALTKRTEPTVIT
ncbi:unnamed protein product (mitochondrion) [Plasmodiophora brassicae]|uniref:phosphoglucomutase (alpha-D-glucose-1,6-bisphosphate-dependent) n=2 Tax=Plasmodiophora brassicae TaxID=37360 RepID=A0A3P3Y6W9_PLABS|nr:unnamed protein product [Plasmodiophora brassicae]